MNFLRKAFHFIFLLISIHCLAQPGCTDWHATNFDFSATVNDGSCVYPFTFLPLSFKCNIDTTELKETSGIAHENNNLWTHEDDANNAIYRIDTLSDSIFQRVVINSSTNNDWEDITTDDDYMYVGDVGNNSGSRTNLRFYKISKSSITPSTAAVNAGRINFSYSDQVDFTTNHNSNFYDCEAFICMNDSIHIFTKGWVNKWTKHYVLPSDTGTQVAQLVDSFNVGGLITSAAIQGDSLVVLLGLNFTGGQNCFVWMLNDFHGSHFFGGNKRRLSIGSFINFGQMEGICFADTNKGFITNERNEFGSFYISSQLREFDLNPYLSPPPPSPNIEPSADSIIQTLSACSDTGYSSFVIRNTSTILGTDLHFSISGFPPWVAASPASDTISPGDSTSITLLFTSGMMSGGFYSTNISIQSNDIYHAVKNIPCTLMVDSNLCMEFIFVSDTCTGQASFTSSPINVPTSYHWEFGDGDTSDLANPVHSYSTSGNFNVTLVGCNDFGCDTVSHYVTSAIHGPVSTPCHTTPQFYCCGAGITHFKLTGPTGDVIDQVSSDAGLGYENFACSDTAVMITGQPYTLTCTTGTSIAEYLKVWLDMNNDGMFDSIAEILYGDLGNPPPLHSGTLNIPALPGNVYGVPLRLRVGSDFQSTPQPCTNPLHGQHEDYAIVLNLSPVTVNEVSNEAEFKLYPNPFTQSININYSLKQSSNVGLDIYNILGEKVATLIELQMQSSGQHQFQFGEQPPGIYFVRLLVDDKVFTERVVKMN